MRLRQLLREDSGAVLTALYELQAALDNQRTGDSPVKTLKYIVGRCVPRIRAGLGQLPQGVAQQAEQICVGYARLYPEWAAYQAALTRATRAENQIDRLSHKLHRAEAAGDDALATQLQDQIDELLPYASHDGDEGELGDRYGALEAQVMDLLLILDPE